MTEGIMTTSVSLAAAAEERRRMIEEAAYARYEQRGYAHGQDLEDWLVAEAHVDRIISKPRKPQPIDVPEPELQQSGGRSAARDDAMKRFVKQHPKRDDLKI